mgnify:FL=1
MLLINFRVKGFQHLRLYPHDRKPGIQAARVMMAMYTRFMSLADSLRMGTSPRLLVKTQTAS